MQNNGVPAGVVQNAEDLQEKDPQLKHRNLYRKMEHPVTGKMTAPRDVIMFSKASCELNRAPLLGEHTDYILKEKLGMSNDEINELKTEGVLE